MPRGVPNCGFRKTAAWSKRTGEPMVDYSKPPQKQPVYRTASTTSFQPSPIAPVYQPETIETDDQILARINSRFQVLADMVDAAISGDIKAVVVSGPAGVGKSHLIETKLEEFDPNGINHIVVKGTVRPTGLFSTLYDYREAGQIVVFDDADSIFSDEQSLNFLKAVCDTKDRRTVSYLSSFELISEKTGEEIPKTFEFEGTIIFISNYDFDTMIEKQSKLAPHLAALISRSLYISLSMKTTRDCCIRIKDVIENGMLSGLDEEQKKDVLRFIFENQQSMRELSLRTAIKVAGLRKNKKNWENIAKITCCKNI